MGADWLFCCMQCITICESLTMGLFVVPMIKQLLLSLFVLALVSSALGNQRSQPSWYNGTYYNGIDTSLRGQEFQSELSTLISSHTNRISYDALWTAFNVTDTHWDSCPGTIHDIYSEKCWTYHGEQCGNYKTEGDCYNREHSWPKSWWGGSSDNEYAYTDLHHIFPSDGYDNSRRSNYPYGNIIPGTETYVTDNGCALGTCKTFKLGQVECWEITDSLKGDLARGYFYMSTRYEDEFYCCSEDGVDDAAIREWMEFTLRSWHNNDPVSTDEMNRQNAIYSIQNNRNPFIDHPEWVSQIYNF